MNKFGFYCTNPNVYGYKWEVTFGVLDGNEFERISIHKDTVDFTVEVRFFRYYIQYQEIVHEKYNLKQILQHYVHKT